MGDMSEKQRAVNVERVRRWWGEYRKNEALSVDSTTRLLSETLLDAAALEPTAVPRPPLLGAITQTRTRHQVAADVMGYLGWSRVARPLFD